MAPPAAREDDEKTRLHLPRPPPLLLLVPLAFEAAAMAVLDSFNSKAVGALGAWYALMFVAGVVAARHKRSHLLVFSLCALAVAVQYALETNRYARAMHGTYSMHAIMRCSILLEDYHDEVEPGDRTSLFICMFASHDMFHLSPADSRTKLRIFKRCLYNTARGVGALVLFLAFGMRFTSEPRGFPLRALRWLLLGVTFEAGLRLIDDCSRFPALFFYSLNPPESYFEPYYSTTLRELWAKNWNRTHGQLVTDSIYKPLVRHRILPRSVARLVTFFATGLWHAAPLVETKEARSTIGSMVLFFVVQAILIEIETLVHIKSTAWVWITFSSSMPLFLSAYCDEFGKSWDNAIDFGRSFAIVGSLPV